MPTYDYRCTACGREIEVVHGIHDSGPAVCELCGGAMRKALSPPAIHFRGAGWAKKDARTASAGKASGATTTADGAAGGGATEAGASKQGSTEGASQQSAEPSGSPAAAAPKATSSATSARASE